MPYPKRYVGHYHNLAKYLNEKGFRVYPMEMVAESVVNERNYVVDVVAMKDRSIWAFEYKSRFDQVKRAIKQVENYVKCFDYVVVVAENLRDLTKYREDFRSLGVGTWHIQGLEITCLDEPKLQEPSVPKCQYRTNNQWFNSLRDRMMDRFMRNTGLWKKRNSIEKLNSLKQKQTLLFEDLNKG